MNIPSNYLPIMPYLILHNAKAFVGFMKNVFDAREQEMHLTPEGKIMHGELKIQDAVIMLGEASENWKEKTAAMYLYVSDVDGICKKAATNGATILHGPEKKEYGYTAGIEDPFGNHWYIVQG